MRLALIADIHGNMAALDAVLQEIAREPVDHVLCLGDIGSLGPQPHEVIDCLRELNCMCLLGNTDAWLLDPPQPNASTSEDGRTIREINAWCAQQLTPGDLAYLKALPPTIEMDLGSGCTLLAYHGSPLSYDDVISSTTPNTLVDEMLAGRSASVMLGGHTHIPMVRRHNDAHIVNPGSIGLAGITAGGPELPSNENVRWAEYGMLSAEHGRLSIELRRVPLDMDVVLGAAARSRMPHTGWWAGTWGAT